MHRFGPERVGAAVRDERGFTVVEALVATFILLAGLLSVVGVFDDSRDQNATGERTEIALMQAEQALEEMRGIPYNRLLLDSGAVDPGSGRVTDAGANLQVKPGLSEHLVYHSTEGVPQENAWVTPTSTVSIGTQEAPLDMTIYRFITWRDEECRVADLSGLGLEPVTGNLTDLVAGVTAPLTNLLGGLIDQVLGLLGGNPALDALKQRLQQLQAALPDPQELDATIDGISDLDLCDIELPALGELQKLGALLPGLGPLAGELDGLTSELGNVLGQVCLPLVGCVLGNLPDEIQDVNGQLDCMFGAGSGQPEFDAYLDGVLTTLDDLSNDARDTDKNSKRITVAVVVEPRTGVGPGNPVWATSVVRDPSAGILTGGASAC